MANDYDPDFEQWKAQNATNLEHYRAQNLGQLEMFRSAIEFAVLTIRSLILVNGGAVVVLMALLGSLWDVNNADDAKELAANLSTPLWFFIVGLSAGVLTGALSYFTQILFSEPQEMKTRKKWGGILRGVAIFLGLTSVVAFGRGSLLAIEAFS